MLRKGLKLKANLPKDFSNKALYHPELYGLRTFEQMLTENILAGLVVFANADGILSKLFEHRAMKLQATNWMLWHPLKVPINLLIDPTNCFLAGATRALKLCNLSLGGDLSDVFRAKNNIAVLDVLSLESYLHMAKSLRRYGIVFVHQLLDCQGVCFEWNTFCRWKKLDPRGPVPVWFVLLVEFINGGGLLNRVALSYCSALADSLCDFGYVNKHLLDSDLSSVTVYTDGSVKDLGSLGVCGGAAVYFPDANVSIRVKIDGLLSSILCVPTSWSVNLFTDNQALLNLCKSGNGVFSPDFHDKCWIKKEHIRHVISKKGLSITWNKVKSHSGVVRNECANFYADATVASKFFLPLVVFYHFLRVEDRLVSGNARHIAKKLFNAVHSVSWEAKCIGSFISAGLCNHFDKAKTFCVWHPDDKIKSGYTSSASATLHGQKKRLYNLRYPSIAYIRCELVEDFDYVFSCAHNANVWETLLSDASMEWNVALKISANGNAIAKLLHKTESSINLFIVLAKGFVLKNWVADMISCLGAGFGEDTLVVDFVCCFAKNGSFFSSVSGLFFLWSVGSIQDFSFRLGVHMCFRLHPCLIKFDFSFLSGFPVAGILDA
ncbi:hypothetical protein G9A89_022217 [Geosiphon pyriformis]|nr:hypothetical protein G9A89_022217 [Geosiphon pyriformis]